MEPEFILIHLEMKLISEEKIKWEIFAKTTIDRSLKTMRQAFWPPCYIIDKLSYQS
jgi:hypothetical protein